MKKYIYLTTLFFLTAGPVAGQTKDPSISFDKEVHDFGAIQEDAGKVTYKFEFTNTGGAPLLISEVRASCGCTTPEWSKEPVLPGKRGFVSATYDPKNRPGPFDKSITVTTNANPASVILHIKGEVSPKPQTMEDLFRYDMGSIRLKSNHLGFARVIKGSTVTQSMELINVSQAPVSLSFNKVPPHLKIRTIPEVFNPNQEGVIEVTYNSGLKNDLGFLSDNVEIMVNGEFTAKNRLTVSASIEEDFANMTPEQKARAPRLQMNEETFDFKEITEGAKIEHEFTLTNTGKSDLMIRKIIPSCGCTTVNPEKNVIRPGETTSMKVMFNSAGKVGTQNKSITVITNDPEKSRQVLWIKGNVVKSGT